MRRAITLIELLVVMAIIAILAGILLPVLSTSRGRARQANCLSNLKQIGTAIELYSDDYDSRLPWVAALGRYQTVTNPREALYGPPYYFLPELLQPYVKHQAAWLCPNVSWDESIRPGQITFRENNGAYSFNYKSPPIPGKAPITISGNQIASFNDPARVSLVWDTRHWPPSQVGVDPPHFGGLDVLFADGHAKWRSLAGRRGRVMQNNYWRDLSWEGLY